MRNQPCLTAQEANALEAELIEMQFNQDEIDLALGLVDQWPEYAAWFDIAPRAEIAAYLESIRLD